MRGALEFLFTEPSRHDPTPVAALPEKEVPQFVRYDMTQNQVLRESFIGGDLFHTGLEDNRVLYERRAKRVGPRKPCCH
jgi:hypothetical protein